MNGGTALNDHDRWLSKRQKIFKLSQGKYKFNKGDTRPKSSRHCSLCGRPLVVYKYDKYITIKDYYLMKNIFPVYLCCDSHNCFHYYQKRMRGD